MFDVLNFERNVLQLTDPRRVDITIGYLQTELAKLSYVLSSFLDDFDEDEMKDPHKKYYSDKSKEYADVARLIRIATDHANQLKSI